ncbi:MAG TPA: hypothetical protein VJT75_17830 [Thermoleophilaceae bacterium]|nr:hypothetical protein [Thermoleophilaceae bacterium]
MRRALATVAAAVLAAALPHSAGAATGIAGYDGENPFDCTLQQLGGGTDFPEPDADPFCVEYEKRHQNVTQLGVVEFLSKEPARVAAAGPKCFYFQRDHWVGSIVQGNQQTQTYAWDGSYWYDKAKGVGGVFVENFSFNGQSGDPSALPGFPAEYKPYFSQGRGGVRAENSVPVDPSCAAKAAKKDPYRQDGPGGGSGSSGSDRCRVPGGTVDRGIGGIRLGQRRSAVRRTLGPPTRESHRWVNYCMTGGGRLVAVFDGRGSAARVLLVMTTARPFDLHGIRPGQRTRKVRGKLDDFRRVAVRNGGAHLYLKRKERQLLLVGASRGTVKFVAAARPKLSLKRVKKLVRSSPSWPRRR